MSGRAIRKQLLACALCCLLASPAFATFGFQTNWDVRTTGADTNGGGFDPGQGSCGTDESQGSGTAVTVTLASGTTGTSSPAVTATTHGPCNFIQIASGSGCTAGTYEILSQAAGVFTVDHTMGSATDVCVGVLGGSLATPAKAVTNSSNTYAAAGNVINLQAGTYTITSTLTMANSQLLIGYQTTHRDGGTKPLITTATNSTVLINASSTVLDNISLGNTAATGADAVYSGGNSGFWQINNSKISGNFTTGVDASNQAGGEVFQLEVFNTEITGCSANAITAYGPVSVVNSWIHGNTAASAASGVIANNVAFTAVTGIYINGSVISGNTGNAIASSQAALGLHLHNSVVSGNSGDGIHLGTSDQYGLTITSSVIYNNGGWGINMQSPSGLAYSYVSGVAFGSNTSGNYQGLLQTPINSIALTASPFVSTSNFALNNTSGGGALLKAAGFPGVTPFGTGYADVGALQSQGGGGATGATFAFLRQQ